MTSTIYDLSDDSTHSHDEINELEDTLTNALGKAIIGVKDGKLWDIIQSYNKSPKGDIIFYQENGRIAILSSYGQIWRFESSKEIAERFNYNKATEVQNRLVELLEEQVDLVKQLPKKEND